MPRKPSWDWKARGCAEVSENYSVPFAVKEYLQNQVGQILKEKMIREWSDWRREDLRNSTPKERKDRKNRLVQTFPGLLTGPHGALVKRSKDWEPIYILSGIVPRAELVWSHYKTDITICTVMWKHSSTGMTGFSFFNNHLDRHASFSTFVMDGASTSRQNLWAIGEKGKGFVLATQYLYEEVEKNMNKLDAALDSPTKSSSPKPKVSFRVGNKIGELAWRKSRYEDEEDLLRVTMDDLSPVTIEEFMRRRAPNKDDESDDENDDSDDMYLTYPTPVTGEKLKKATKSLIGIYKRRFTQQLAMKDKSVSEAHDPSDEESLVTPDEVSITVLELSVDLQPEYAFSGIYGVIQQAKSWRVPGTSFQFFKPDDQPVFYNRDQLVISGPPMNILGINYHGDLTITADRVGIVMSPRSDRYQRYLGALGDATDEAFRTMPDLAIQLACDMLTDEGQGVGTLTHQLNLADDAHGEEYRTAFIAAWKILDPELSPDGILYPCKSEKQDMNLIKELGMVPVPVKSDRIRTILSDAGAFKDIYHYCRELLTTAYPSAKVVPGFERLRRAITSLLPSVDSSSIILRDYKFSYPKVGWDKKHNTFSVPIPDKCEFHLENDCLCWVGPCLSLAISNWAEDDHEGVEEPTQSAIWRVFMSAMDGVVDMKEHRFEPAVEPNVNSSDSFDGDYGMGDDSGNDEDEDGEQSPSPGIYRSRSHSPRVLQVSGEPSGSDSSREVSAAAAISPTPRSSSTTPGPTVRDEAPRTPQESPTTTARSARLVIPENHSFIAHMNGLQATFDQEVKRANDAEAQLEALRTKLIEEQTTNLARQSLIETKNRQVVMLQGQLAKLQPFLDGLREQLEPTRAIIDGISRHGEGDKRQREEDGGDENSRGEGSSKRLRWQYYHAPTF
ncbi:hypothetical protein PILCRDRAFT_819651 [Piloderma croceum F 1598]|uniref:Uncharacterized protein n=1 Tax=Piloderma croceum (strain F 1598) TaxID=765440 RepID=A0A0C3FYS9_PILCF|nr:hypothetical protein PILCRDRAFT_819651 [Piloderma croceum F 1598]